jgi:hypothetical protein
MDDSKSVIEFWRYESTLKLVNKSFGFRDLSSFDAAHQCVWRCCIPDYSVTCYMNQNVFFSHLSAVLNSSFIIAHLKAYVLSQCFVSYNC